MRYYSSTARAMQLQAPVNPSSTALIVDSVSGLPVSTPFTVVLSAGSDAEEVATVTSIAGTTLTVVRGEDGSVAMSHGAGAEVRHMVTARDLREPQQHIEATAAHGTTSDVVGVDDEQTLTNKTINASANTLEIAVTDVTGLEDRLTPLDEAVEDLDERVDGLEAISGDTGWVDIPLNSGFLGSLALRRINGVVYTKGTVTVENGSADGSRVMGSVPVGMRPGATTSWLAAVSNQLTTGAIDRPNFQVGSQLNLYWADDVAQTQVFLTGYSWVAEA